MPEHTPRLGTAEAGKRALDAPSDVPKAKRRHCDLLDELRTLADAKKWTELKSKSDACLKEEPWHSDPESSDLLKQQSQRSVLHNFLGRAKANLKDMVGALASFQAALEADPSNDQAALNKKRADIEIMLAGGKVAAAKARCEELLVEEPDRSVWHDKVCHCMWLMGDRESAVKRYKVAAGQFAEDYTCATNALRCELAMHGENGNFDMMRTRIKAALAQRPQEAWLHIELGVVSAWLEDQEESVAAFRQAAALDPNGVDERGKSYVQLMRIAELEALRNVRDWPAMKAKCEEHLVSWPEDAELHHFLGEANNDLGNPQGALSAFREAVRLEPKNEIFILSVASVKLDGTRSREHWNNVKATCEELLGKNPQSAHLQAQLGFAKRLLCDHEGAAAAFNVAAELETGRTRDTYFEFAERARFDRLRLAGEWDSFANLARELISKNPEIARYHEELSKAQKRRGDRQGMLDSLREAARLDPGSFEEKFHTAHIDMIADAGNIAEVEAHVTGLIQTKPPAAWLYVELGFAQYVLGKQALALKAFRQALTIEPECRRLELRLIDFAYGEDSACSSALCTALIEMQPKSAFLHGMLGNVLHMQEDFEGALAALSEAARLLPGSFYTTQAQKIQLLLLRAQGDWEGLQGRCQSLLAASPGNAVLHQRLGRACERLGDFVEARRSYQEALRLAPDKHDYVTNVARTDQFVLLPEVSFSVGSFPSNEQACCHICLEDYSTGDVLRRLPCGHHLHSSCAGRALAVRSCRGCPVCRRPVFLAELAESSSDWDSEVDDDDSDIFSEAEFADAAGGPELGIPPTLGEELPRDPELGLPPTLGEELPRGPQLGMPPTLGEELARRPELGWRSPELRWPPTTGEELPRGPELGMPPTFGEDLPDSEVQAGGTAAEEA